MSRISSRRSLPARPDAKDAKPTKLTASGGGFALLLLGCGLFCIPVLRSLPVSASTAAVLSRIAGSQKEDGLLLLADRSSRCEAVQIIFIKKEYAWVVHSRRLLRQAHDAPVSDPVAWRHRVRYCRGEARSAAADYNLVAAETEAAVFDRTGLPRHLSEDSV